MSQREVDLNLFVGTKRNDFDKCSNQPKPSTPLQLTNNGTPMTIIVRLKWLLWKICALLLTWNRRHLFIYKLIQQNTLNQLVINRSKHCPVFEWMSAVWENNQVLSPTDVQIKKPHLGAKDHDCLIVASQRKIFEKSFHVSESHGVDNKLRTLRQLIGCREMACFDFLVRRRRGWPVGSQGTYFMDAP